MTSFTWTRVADVLHAIRAPIQKESQPIGKTRTFAEVH
jgi:hypothetical protein